MGPWRRPQPPPINPVHLHRENLTVSGIALETQLKTTLWIDGDDAPYVGERDLNFPQIGRFSFFVKSPPTNLGWGGHLGVEAEGYVPIRNLSVPTGVSDHELPSQVLEKVPIRTRPHPSRLVTRGRRLLRSDGLPWNWQGLTAFRLAEMVHAGRQAEVEAYCAWAAAHHATILRVFTMAGSHNGNGIPYLFRLDPADGRRALPELLEIAGSHGLYVDAVLLVDTRYFTFDHRQHVAEAGVILASHDNTVGECSNEPSHSTQADAVAGPAYLQSLRALVDGHVPMALGAAHGSDDESRAYVGGNFIVVHGDRNPGDNPNDRGWRMVRHTNEQRALSEEQQKYVVNNEPSRTMAPDQHLAMAILCRMSGLGDTFHSGAGLQARIPEGDELVAFEARRRGWLAIPTDWQGGYKNVGHADSPVRDADWSTVVRVYSSIRGAEGYTLALGGSAPSFTWSESWPQRELLIQEGSTSLWLVSR